MAPLLLLLLAACLGSGTYAANILYINTVASPSHFGWNRALMYELASRGHNLTVFGVDTDPNPPPNVTFILLEDVYDKLYSDPSVNTDFFEMSKIGPFSMQLLFNEFVFGVCEIVLATEGAKRLQSYPADFGFDLIIHDYLSGPCLAALAHHRFRKPPVIAVTAYHGISTTLSMTGSYQYSALVPNHAYDATENMSYKERFINVLVNMEEEILQAYVLIPASNKLLRKYDPTLPDVADFYSETKLVLLNANPIIQYTEPFMPNIIPVGGLQIIKPKPLPADLASVLEQAGPDGVILFSLGTNVRSDLLGEARILAIIGAMEALPQYTFIWKFESDTLPRALPSNVHVKKWLPQNDLLAQPAVKLFITHSGLLSTQEAIWHGVPIIGFPVFADQFKNINYCVAKGVGLRLNIEHLDKDELVRTVREIMTTESYRTNMKRMSALFRDQPEHPLDRAAWWVEWVLRHPDATELLTHGSRLHLFVKYSYDVLIPLFVSLALALHGLFFIVRRLFCRRKATPKTGNKQKKS
ncbi:UDP-glucosyltransferase 2-like [Anopheles stephensi]|uniref:UDP-glucosyltransferase 2-like n=1 Tax=Anopheles stephensi TaxID=30069 RepID=UPI0016589075|nr:UDP-glucosyltransferase 2-like [Anopheles stephensi]XP_035917255.1 UDP-glucosyltransferase 2-like [Anopheles stephensi]